MKKIALISLCSLATIGCSKKSLNESIEAYCQSYIDCDWVTGDYTYDECVADEKSEFEDDEVPRSCYQAWEDYYVCKNSSFSLYPECENTEYNPELSATEAACYDEDDEAACEEADRNAEAYDAKYDECDALGDIAEDCE